MQLAEKYGPVFSLRRGSQRMVFISGYKMVREALVNQLDSFADRPIIPLFHDTYQGLGKKKKEILKSKSTNVRKVKVVRIMSAKDVDHLLLMSLGEFCLRQKQTKIPISMYSRHITE